MSKPEPSISAERQIAPFTAYVLFDAPLAFATADVISGLTAAYPAIRWATTDTGHQDTSDIVRIGLNGIGRRGRVNVDLTALPGPLPGTLEVPIGRSKLFEGAADAVAGHQSYLCISAESSGLGLSERFTAAQHVTCVAAFFAAMDAALGVYFPSADQIVSPQGWVDAAATAHLDEWPVEHWISYHLSKVHEAEARAPEYSCGSIGMAAFNGHEIAFPLATVAPADAAKAVCGAVYLLSTGADLFAPAANLDLEDGHAPLRVRYLAEGEHGAQTRTWLLVHPTSRLYTARLGTGIEDAPLLHPQGEERYTIQKRPRLN